MSKRGELDAIERHHYDNIRFLQGAALDAIGGARAKATDLQSLCKRIDEIRATMHRLIVESEERYRSARNQIERKKVPVND